ncbi:hypothetical protein NHX12_026179 [Muraenolepis orangiensis]|uniref:Major facilitator superfamily (MFS) profile domain-containing protein n=1 Tax=Muraenolepis orangiensis TaxID=630683 RepID=A0A9Q0EG20_9TELE|nr:hypothetical protein NHX12_026179 [Muraenolepis orangiensis]
MNFEEILSGIGGFGKFQKILYVWICLPQMFLAFHMLVSIFTEATPPHACSSTPSPTDGPVPGFNGSLLPGRGEPTVCPDVLNGSSAESCPGGWEYSTEVFQSTVVTEWDLVCEHASLNNIISSVYMCGLLVGALGFGILSDKYGRRPVMLVGLAFQAVFGVGAAYAPNLYVYTLLRFMVGTAISAVLVNAFVLGTEWTGSKHRMLAGLLTDYFFGLGYILLAGVAYLVRDWRHLQLAISAPGFLFFFYIWVLPRSARWLMANRREEEALQLISRAAKLNGNPLPEDLNDVYWNHLVFGLVEIPARTMVLFTINYSRRLSQAGYLWVCGLACLLSIFIPHECTTMRMALNLVGKFGVTASLSVIYIYTAEVFPTVIRQNGIGMGSTCARVGGVLAPVVHLLQDYYVHIPMILFGLSSLIGAALTLLLPETANQPLRETIEDVKRGTPTTSKETYPAKPCSFAACPASEDVIAV